MCPLCYMPDGRLICYQCGYIVIIVDGKVISRYLLFSSFKERVIGRFRLIYRCLRLGIRSAAAIDNSSVVLSTGNFIYELNVYTGELSKGYFCGEGIRPLTFTYIKGIQGVKEGLYFGGYLGNKDKRPVTIYRRLGLDSWIEVYTFSQGTINHVHNIVADPYRNCLWIFTGDFGDASAIWKVTGDFAHVKRVLCNDQKYRACVAFVLPEGVLYATDAPFADNYVFLLNPETLEIKKIYPLAGSSIYGCQWKDNYVFSSTVEGDGRETSKMEFLFGRKRGIGIKNDYIHLYIGNVKAGFNEVYQERKDCMPYYTFQFGVFKFPHGKNEGNSLYFQTIATKKHDLDLMCLER